MNFVYSSVDVQRERINSERFKLNITWNIDDSEGKKLAIFLFFGDGLFCYSIL